MPLYPLNRMLYRTGVLNCVLCCALSGAGVMGVASMTGCRGGSEVESAEVSAVPSTLVLQLTPADRAAAESLPRTIERRWAGLGLEPMLVPFGDRVMQVMLSRPGRSLEQASSSESQSHRAARRGKLSIPEDRLWSVTTALTKVRTSGEGDEEGSSDDRPSIIAISRPGVTLWLTLPYLATDIKPARSACPTAGWRGSRSNRIFWMR